MGCGQQVCKSESALPSPVRDVHGDASNDERWWSTASPRPVVQVEQGVEEGPGSYEGHRRVVITIKLILV